MCEAARNPHEESTAAVIPTAIFSNKYMKPNPSGTKSTRGSGPSITRDEGEKLCAVFAPSPRGRRLSAAQRPRNLRAAASLSFSTRGLPGTARHGTARPSPAAGSAGGAAPTPSAAQGAGGAAQGRGSASAGVSGAERLRGGCGERLLPALVPDCDIRRGGGEQ